MIQLVIDNSYSRITGLSVKQHKELKALLSYDIDPQQAYFSGNFRSKRSLLGARGDFPTGLLYLVEKYLKGGFQWSAKDLRVRPAATASLELNLPYEPYPEQIEAAMECLSSHRGIVVAPTGVGKSVIITLIISKLKVKTLVVVPSLELKRQLTGTLKAAFGGDKVGGYGFSVAVENVDALDPNQEANYDCVIVDEWQHAAAKTYRTLNKRAWRNIYYRFGVTATPFRSNENERLLLESILSEVIYRIDYKTAVAKGYIVPLEAYYVDVLKKQTDGYTWAEVYKDLVVNNGPRNDIIATIMDRMLHASKSTLCLVKEIAHGEALISQVFGQFANGQDGRAEALISSFCDRTLHNLIATTGVCGEGVDTKPAEYIIIAGLGKSRPAFMQQCGRGFRKYPGKESCKIIIFRDASHKFTLRHFNEQVKILKQEYGVKPVRLEL